MTTTRKRIVGTGLAAAAIGLSGLGAVAATGSEAPATVEDRCAEAVSTWPVGDVPIPEGCGCDHEALAAAIGAESPVELIHEDGSRSTMQPEDFISPAMVEACPDLPAMRESARRH